jgi:hypothetical protein
LLRLPLSLFKLPITPQLTDKAPLLVQRRTCRFPFDVRFRGTAKPAFVTDMGAKRTFDSPGLVETKLM